MDSGVDCASSDILRLGLMFWEGGRLYVAIGSS